MKYIDVKLEVFEGPFDLLFHLIEKNEVDIYDIPINTITEQYLEYVRNMTYIDMDNMSEFILMSATLIEIKSKMLLPKKEEDKEDPRAELVDRLLEYKQVKELVETLKNSEQLEIFTKEAEKILQDSKPDIKIEDVLKDTTLTQLYNLFEMVLARQTDKVDTVRSEFNRIPKDSYTIQDKKEHIKNLLSVYGSISFFEIFDDDTVKIEKIITFLAMLELIKLNELIISQTDVFGEIILYKN